MQWASVLGGLMDHGHGAVKPAHETKHVPLLAMAAGADAVVHLSQRDDGVDNGTTLWLAGQLLAMALPALLTNSAKGTKSQKRAIELGSGTGYTALALASMGWDVVATDTQSVIRSVLQQNIENNKLVVSGSIHVRELDWTAARQWDASDCVGFDLILTADTLYVPDLVEPLLRTMHLLARHSPSAAVFVAVERRDGRLLDDALERARSQFGFSTQRVSDSRLARAIRKARCEWQKHVWTGVQLWKLALRS